MVRTRLTLIFLVVASAMLAGCGGGTSAAPSTLGEPTPQPSKSTQPSASPQASPPVVPSPSPPPPGSSNISYYNLGSLVNDQYGSGIYAAPDGKIYYGAWGTPGVETSNVGQFDPVSKSFVEVPIYGGSTVNFLQTADGALWATADGTTQPTLLRISPFTSSGLTQIQMPAGAGFPEPLDLALGPDGNVWFTIDTGTIGTISSAGPYTTSSIKTFSVPASPFGITEGPDGNLWFSDHANGAIYKMTVSGATTAYQTPDQKNKGGSEPALLRRGSDGRMYFSDDDPSTSYPLESVDTNGNFQNIPVNSSLISMQSAGTGKVVFLENHDIGVYSIATNKVADIPVQTANGPVSREPSALTVSADGNVWFLCYGGVKYGQPLCMGELQLTPVWTVYPIGTILLSKSQPWASSQVIGIAESGDSAPFTAASSNPNVANVAPSGLTNDDHNFTISALGKGQATVTVTDRNGRSLTVPVIVW